MEIVQVKSRPLSAIAPDELHRIAIAAGPDADLIMLTGRQPPGLVEGELYRPLAVDLRANGKLVVADLTGPPLRATMEGPGSRRARVVRSRPPTRRGRPGTSFVDGAAVGKSCRGRSAFVWGKQLPQLFGERPQHALGLAG